MVQLFAPIGARLAELCSKYTTEELSVILGFMVGSSELVKASAEELRERSAAAGKKKAGP
jgi:hypothetical protein